MLTRVELKRLNDRSRVRVGVVEKLGALRQIAYARHCGQQRDFTTAEASEWAGDLSSVWEGIALAAEQGRLDRDQYIIEIPIIREEGFFAYLI